MCDPSACNLSPLQAKLVAELEAKLLAAEEKVRTFNSREDLFGADMTDYENVGQLRKMFEPYSNLWATTERYVGHA